MAKIQHKEIRLKSSINKLKAYSDENYWSIHHSSDKETFISTVTAKSSSSKIKINLLYEGLPSEVSNELLDNFLCQSDSSYNPSRPFRWYRGNICVMTTSEEEIHKGRLDSFDILLKELEYPEKIFIYEIENV